MHSVIRLTFEFNGFLRRGIRRQLIPLGLVCLLVPAPGYSQSIEEIDRIVAIVNNDVIVNSELEQRINQVRLQLMDAGNQAPPYHILQKQTYCSDQT